MRVKYVGGAPEVAVPAIGRRVEHGKSIEVPAAIGKQLLKQSGWSRPEITSGDDTNQTEEA
jgi:hypothetical protein